MSLNMSVCLCAGTFVFVSVCMLVLMRRSPLSASSLSDEASRAALQSGKVAAEAVEEFGEVLEHLRLEVDELSGGKFGGEVRAGFMQEGPS